MGNISGYVEGGYMLAGEVSGPHICTTDQGVVIKATVDGPIINTGNNAGIYNDIECVIKEQEEDANGLFVSSSNDSNMIITGNDSSIETNGQANTVTSLGDGSVITYTYWHSFSEVSPYSRIMSENTTYVGGNKSELFAGHIFAFQDSVVMSTGDKNEISINVGEDPDAKSKNNKVVTSGIESLVWMESADSVAVTLGENSITEVGESSVIFASESSVKFKLGAGSCAAIAWHDGTRKRIKVVYEGENGILADTQYTIDQNGNVVAV